MIAALYVDPKGLYPSFSGVDCWDEMRDARKYAGEHPVIAHPPCGRWSKLARVNEVRWGAKVGDDGGCFESALTSVRRCGGVLEHPAGSLAWAKFGLLKPIRGAWLQTGCGGWVTEVSQVAYGHPARKRTWLYVVSSAKPTDVDWSEPQHTHRCGDDKNSRKTPTLGKRAACMTPIRFAELLIALAKGCTK